MREIRFRAKTVVRKQWAHGSLITYPDGSADIHGVDILRTGSQRIEFMQVDRETACQFTGCYDKNCTEIYEGDIIKCCKGQKRKSPSDDWEDDNEYYVVEYNGGSFSGVSAWCLSLDAVEVIGNKLDNPNLVKKYVR